MNIKSVKKVILHISGKVQQVGYRAKVVYLARAFGIKGSVQNLLDGRIKIVAEGKEDNLEKFIKSVNINNTLINITNIDKEYSGSVGDYDDFYKLVNEGETDERLDTAAGLLKELIHVTKNGLDRLENKQDIMIEKQDIMIEKQDIMIEKQTETMGKIDQSRIEITSEIRSTKDDFKSHINERFSMIEADIAEIKAKVML